MGGVERLLDGSARGSQKGVKGPQGKVEGPTEGSKALWMGLMVPQREFFRHCYMSQRKVEYCY